MQNEGVVSMTYVEIIFTVISIVVAFIVGVGQIYIAKRVMDFEAKQDERDEKRRNEQIYSEATQFIQKYNKNGHESELYLLPLCVAAYKYNPVYPYRREIYRDFCVLTEEVQNKILKQCNIDIRSERINDYYSNILDRITHTLETYYGNDENKSRFYYDHGKYFERALLHHGDKTQNDLRCEIDEHLTNLFAYHAHEKPLSSLLGLFQQSKEIVAAYICCRIAIITADYNYNLVDDFKVGYVDDYSGEQYMEDLFLKALYTVENYNVVRES